MVSQLCNFDQVDRKLDGMYRDVCLCNEDTTDFDRLDNELVRISFHPKDGMVDNAELAQHHDNGRVYHLSTKRDNTNVYHLEN